uniref:Gly-zipper_Omp domain-containing protein n=1 Tax=Meloidogyne hapla TaxID=6305 RepID=A0A1I8BDU6_MELHA
MVLLIRISNDFVVDPYENINCKRELPHQSKNVVENCCRVVNAEYEGYSIHNYYENYGCQCCYEMKKGFQSYVDLTMKGCWMGNFVIEFCHYFIDKYEESLEENYDKHDSLAASPLLYARYSTRSKIIKHVYKLFINRTALDCVSKHPVPKYLKVCTKSNEWLKDYGSEVNNREEETKKSKEEAKIALGLEGRIAEATYIAAGTAVGAVIGGALGSGVLPGVGTTVGGVFGGAIGGFIVKEAMDWLKSTEDGWTYLTVAGTLLTGGITLFWH